MTKAELRKIYLQKRLALDDVEYVQLNLNICKNFFADINLTGINTVHLFLPIAKNKETDTWPIIEKIKTQYPQIRISIPRINGQTAALENFFFEGHEQLKENAWGISQPQHGIPVQPEEIDMVIVPLLACDQQGHRVGYGKGFYDKFLSICKAECLKVGLSFFQPVEKIDDVTPMDVSLNYCVTPFEVYHF